MPYILAVIYTSRRPYHSIVFLFMKIDPSKRLRPMTSLPVRYQPLLGFGRRCWESQGAKGGRTKQKESAKEEERDEEDDL